MPKPNLRWFHIAIVVLVAVILLTPGMSSAIPLSQTVNVSVLDNRFDPPSITIGAGTTVVWTNNGNNPHTATSDSGLWDSGVYNRGQSYSRKFDTAGTFPYNCTLHRALGMVGTITVQAAATVTPASPTPTATFTPQPPTVTSTPAPATPTATPVPPTPTPLPPTLTPVPPTPTPLPPATPTPLPPLTPTATLVPPTPTLTPVPVVRTPTPAPATFTPTATRPAVTPTATRPLTPTLKILAPADDQNVTVSEVTVQVQISNLTLAPGAIGQANQPGQGHWHLLLDGKLVQPVGTESFTLTGVTTGPHTIKVELHNNDHSPLSPPVEATVRFAVETPGGLLETIQANLWLVVAVVVGLAIVTGAVLWLVKTAPMR